MLGKLETERLRAWRISTRPQVTWKTWADCDEIDLWLGYIKTSHGTCPSILIAVNTWYQQIEQVMVSDELRRKGYVVELVTKLEEWYQQKLDPVSWDEERKGLARALESYQETLAKEQAVAQP